MIGSICYKFASLFFDVYERRTTSCILNDRRIAHTHRHEYNVETELFKNGLPIPVDTPLPPNWRRIHKRENVFDTNWDPAHVEFRAKTEVHRVSVVPKIRNILLAAPFAIYLAGRALMAYGNAL